MEETTPLVRVSDNDSILPVKEKMLRSKERERQYAACAPMKALSGMGVAVAVGGLDKITSVTSNTQIRSCVSVSNMSLNVRISVRKEGKGRKQTVGRAEE